eukprot:CAMPEP_0183313756 /NCGR_PEP_ID=MMETSP0160_2-20130417/46407_1 /TAXON_ID=2839 ORGANISM="Odontella Sinensis, Strain Grunow 1884" /NCGR_SAMPLE_ID=MMETSP0160_2 /ASSEMBLY_ACC=CAM_ASM_000250 /LENGTH=114 /DNA_ID=CAMNT_0025478909 /DNA_START=146 /DNA_END=492 /DNA_ORIENTATION=-
MNASRADATTGSETVISTSNSTSTIDDCLSLLEHRQMDRRCRAHAQFRARQASISTDLQAVQLVALYAPCLNSQFIVVHAYAADVLLTQKGWHSNRQDSVELRPARTPAQHSGI